ncbi:ATP-binding protein [Streptomyces sp. NPDC020667]|uniref:ATP-binding protein n=1 Tax=Streptomyces sp. NPDC020667 TaxID=3154895 RepID=UPI0033DE4EFA
MSTATLATPLTSTTPKAARTYQLTAPATATTAHVARSFVTAALAANAHERLIGDACVCVSDAVANVVTHARVAALTVEVAVHDNGSVVAAVRDNDPGRLPRPRSARADAENGRGLTLVRRLAHASGVTLLWDELRTIGKEVWFVLREDAQAGE